MKTTTFTPALIKFALAAALLTLLFRLGLSSFLEHKQFVLVIVIAVLYGISMYISGRYFGTKDHKYLPIHDIGFRFHLTTFLVYNLISYSRYILKLQSSLENITQLYNTSLICFFFLVIHGYYYIKVKKNSIRNLDKRDLFE